MLRGYCPLDFRWPQFLDDASLAPVEDELRPSLDDLGLRDVVDDDLESALLESLTFLLVEPPLKQFPVREAEAVVGRIIIYKTIAVRHRLLIGRISGDANVPAAPISLRIGTAR